MRTILILAAALGLASGSSVHAAIVGPYSADANTLHLYHLDETGTPAADQAHYNYAGTFTTKPDANQPMNALFGGATLGNAGASGFGTALSTKPAVLPVSASYAANSVQPGLGALTPVNGTADNADHTFDNPTTHAFTMEALIKVGWDTATTFQAPQEIIAGEGDASDSSDRSWQFRIEARTNAANPWVLRFQKVSGFGGIGGSTGNYNLDANIPSTGINAIANDTWYHVAVTYNGSLSDPAALKLYWTKLDGSNIVANQIGSGLMNGWLREQDTDFAIGNEMRDFNGNTEPFAGLIDEVRISDVARAANEMQFVPEPTALAVLGAAGLLTLRRRK
ncbi:MAG: PEP-CTERM sorting domain-containing protein [Tepidisphaeraceae bacterium]